MLLWPGKLDFGAAAGSSKFVEATRTAFQSGVVWRVVRLTEVPPDAEYHPESASLFFATVRGSFVIQFCPDLTNVNL